MRFPTDLPDDALPPPVDQNAPVSSLYVARISDGELQVVLRGQLLDDEPAVPTDAEGLSEVADGEPFTVEGVNGETRFRVAVRQLPGSGAVSVVALPLDEVDAAIARLRLALVLSTAAIAAVLAVALWWVERLGLRPVARVTAAADAIAHGDREHRVVDANPRTEAGRLANAFNVMLDERDASEGRLRQFVADASHELRTPLTSIRGYLDLYRQGGFREPSQLDDMIRRMRQESGRMNDLVEDLLLLTQLDQHRPLRSEDVDVGRLVRDAAVDAQVIQPDRPVVVSVDDERGLGGHRRSLPPAAGDRRAGHERAGVHRPHERAAPARPLDRRSGRVRRGGSRPRARRARRGEGVRPLLPRRGVTRPPHRRVGTRLGDRQVDRRGPRRHDHADDRTARGMSIRRRSAPPSRWCARRRRRQRA